MSKLKIEIIGAGSAVFLMRIIPDLCKMSVSAGCKSFVKDITVWRTLLIVLE